MSEPLKVGDLALVVAWPCCGTYLGYVRRVTAFVNLRAANCHVCGQPGPTDNAELSEAGRAPVAWLKRIPPIEELDDVKRDEEITA